MTFDQARDEDHEAEDQVLLTCPECGSSHILDLFFQRQCMECDSTWVIGGGCC